MNHLYFTRNYPLRLFTALTDMLRPPSTLPVTNVCTAHLEIRDDELSLRLCNPNVEGPHLHLSTHFWPHLNQRKIRGIELPERPEDCRQLNILEWAEAEPGVDLDPVVFYIPGYEKDHKRTERSTVAQNRREDVGMLVMSQIAHLIFAFQEFELAKAMFEKSTRSFVAEPHQARGRHYYVDIDELTRLGPRKSMTPTT